MDSDILAITGGLVLYQAEKKVGICTPSVYFFYVYLCILPVFNSDVTY